MRTNGSEVRLKVGFSARCSDATWETLDRRTWTLSATRRRDDQLCIKRRTNQGSTRECHRLKTHTFNRSDRSMRRKTYVKPFHRNRFLNNKLSKFHALRIACQTHVNESWRSGSLTVASYTMDLAPVFLIGGEHFSGKLRWPSMRAVSPGPRKSKLTYLDTT